MKPDLDFATWLSRRLVERGISQRQLGERSGVHHTSISRLLRGERQPTHRTARRLMQVLDAPRADPGELTRFLRRDPFLLETDVQRIVGLYRTSRALRQRDVLAAEAAHDVRAGFRPLADLPARPTGMDSPAGRIVE